MAELASAETGGKIYVSLKDFAADYIGHAIFVRPKFAFDARSDYHSQARDRQLVLGHAETLPPDLCAHDSGVAADQPLRAGVAAFHHERL